jgi:ribosome biogenesis GTPase
MNEAKVVKSTGSWYTIQTKEGEQINARIVGKFRLNNVPLTNPVAVGDEVGYELEEGGETSAVIKEILPRKNYIVRQSPRKKHQLHLLASNLDLAVLVVTMVQPNLKQGVIDRFLLMTEPQDIPAAIIFNKADLYHKADVEFFEYCQAVYESIGYQVFLVSCLTKDGIDQVRQLLQGKTTLIAGQSGVGKSTLVNTLDPNLELRTTELSDYSGKGQHTTTFAEMHPLNDGFIIDTPGFKTLSFNNLEPMDVAHNFREFFILSDDCRFPDCTHRSEPQCAVKKALEVGEISELRYNNYLKILEEIEDQNYWERHHDL